MWPSKSPSFDISSTLWHASISIFGPEAGGGACAQVLARKCSANNQKTRIALYRLLIWPHYFTLSKVVLHGHVTQWPPQPTRGGGDLDGKWFPWSARKPQYFLNFFSMACDENSDILGHKLIQLKRQLAKTINIIRHAVRFVQHTRDQDERNFHRPHLEWVQNPIHSVQTYKEGDMASRYGCGVLTFLFWARGWRWGLYTGISLGMLGWMTVSSVLLPMILALTLVFSL